MARKKIIILSGAGISVAAKIPDFHTLYRHQSRRSPFEISNCDNGDSTENMHGDVCITNEKASRAVLTDSHQLEYENVVRTLRNLMFSRRQSGRSLFDINNYNNDYSTQNMHRGFCIMNELAFRAVPTDFHRLANENDKRILRHFTQNVDGLHDKFQSLSPDSPLTEKGPWTKTIELHGRLDRIICHKCKWRSAFDPKYFQGSELSACPNCIRRDIDRQGEGKRSRDIGVLRPDVLLDGEIDNQDEDAIAAVSRDAERQVPDLVLIVGTQLKKLGAFQLATRLCEAAKTGNRRNPVIWMNKEPPSRGLGPKFHGLIDYAIYGDCQEIARYLLDEATPP